jgi:hypothetical protein
MPDILSRFNAQGSRFSELNGAPGFTNTPPPDINETEFVNLAGEVNSPTNDEPSPLSNLNGNNPSPAISDLLTTSELHNTYSLNGEPNVPGKPNPSTLDLNGRNPARYQDNAPPGAQGNFSSTITS